MSSVLSSLDNFALKVYDEREPELETEGFSKYQNNVILVIAFIIPFMRLFMCMVAIEKTQ